MKVLDELLAAVGAPAGEVAIRLPSASNHVVRVGNVVVRLPTRARSGVDHRHEAANARVAAAAGVGAQVLLARDDGALVTELVAGVPLTPEGVRADRALVARMGALLATVHGLPPFAGSFDPWAATDALLDELRPQDGWWRLREDLEAVRFPPSATVPCHVDPWPGNVLVGEDRLVLVDWEYSAMSDPLWDLADFAVEADLDMRSRRSLLHAHGSDGPDQERRVRIYEALADLHWATWLLLEEAAGNSAEDFREQSTGRLARAGATIHELAPG
jgi:aminoglycoside phosphotransferase (APT) family kinase protein